MRKQTQPPDAGGFLMAQTVILNLIQNLKTMQERLIPKPVYKKIPASPRTFLLSNEAFRRLPTILYDLSQTEPVQTLIYTWSAHEPFILTTNLPFPTDTLLHRLNESNAPIEELFEEIVFERK